MPIGIDDFADLKPPTIDENDEGQDQARETSKRRPVRNKQKPEPKPEKGIGPKSPTIYLLSEEKNYLERLKAYITLTTGKKMTDHTLVMNALKEYVRKEYKGFKDMI